MTVGGFGDQGVGWGGEGVTCDCDVLLMFVF